MCNRRCYDAPAAAVSILVGVAFGILSLLGLLIIDVVIPVIALAVAALELLLLVLGTTSLLRQNVFFDRCICERARRLLIAALLLLAIAIVALIITGAGAVVNAIFVFLIFTLLTLTLFSLFCLLSCLIGAGCEEE